MIKTDKNLNISVESLQICTEPSEQGSFFQAGQNESKECYAMIKTNENSNISAESQPIYTKPFHGMGGMLNFGHAKSAINIFHQISKFSFWGGGGGGTLNYGHAKSAIKIFHQISNFSFLGGWGVHQTLVMPNLP